MKRRLPRIAIIVVALAVVLLVATPTIVAKGVRLWIWWVAREEALTCTVDSIDAPFLHPVELRGIHLTGERTGHLDVRAAHVSMSLNLRSILLRSRGRAIADLKVDNVQGEWRRTPGSAELSLHTWNAWQKSLPERFALTHVNLRVEDGPTVVMLREVSLSASEVENGEFSAGDVTVMSPLMRQTFSGLRGSTNWQNDHLTLSGLNLARGLDAQAITADLSRLSKQHVGLEFDLDAFGGKIRGNVATEWRGHQSNLNLAGSATDISLAQTSEALGLTDRFGGKMHACKFTFRGDPHDATHAVASVWMELTGMSWRNRSADVIMIGAALYNRQVQLQQLYVKQGNNELNLTGDAAFPDKTFDWLNPDFRGTISASVDDLGEFARLFGAHPGDFAGEVEIEGTMNAGNRNIGGHITASGKSLSILKMPVDTFAAKLTLSPTTLEIEQLELRQQKDSLTGQGKIDLGKDHAYSAKVSAMTENLTPYLRFLPAPWRDVVRGGALNGEWTGTGKTTTHSGSVHVAGRGVRLNKPFELAPLNADIQADYTPGNVFIKQAHLTNDHLSLNGFGTVAANYLQAQALALDFDGKPVLRGNAFLPVSLVKLSEGAAWLDAIDRTQKMDIDFNVEQTNLEPLILAARGHADATGLLAGRIAIFGSIDALQGWADFHVREFGVADDPARVSVEGETRFSSGSMNARTTLLFSGSQPVTFNAVMPVRLVANAVTEPMTSTIDFPTLNFAHLPRYLPRHVLRDGSVAGRLSITGTLEHPLVTGEAQLTNAQFGPANVPLPDVSARLSFKDSTATIDPLVLGGEEAGVSLRGELHFANPPKIDFALTAIRPFVDQAPTRGNECINGLKVNALPAGQPVVSNVGGIALHGDFWRGGWTLELAGVSAADGPAGPGASKKYAICGVPDAGNGSPLVFGGEAGMKPKPTPPKTEPPKTKKRPKRNG